MKIMDLLSIDEAKRDHSWLEKQELFLKKIRELNTCTLKLMTFGYQREDILADWNLQIGCHVVIREW